MNDYITYGLPDDSFIRADVPMTKEEVRTIIISKLRLKIDHVVIDIGAGTGSISIEVARLIKKGRVYAVDSNKKAVELIKKNCIKFNINNIEIINAEAPDLNLKIHADRIIIGGSGERLANILDWQDSILKHGGRLVAAAVTIETLNTINAFLNEKKYSDIDIVQVSINKTKKIGSKNMFFANNPVFIISGEKN